LKAKKRPEVSGGPGVLSIEFEKNIGKKVRENSNS